MKQLKNFLSKREQSRAGSGFAECEKSRLKAKLLMTLVALIALTTHAWAQTGENIFQYCYDCQRDPAYPKTTASATLSGFQNPYVGYNGSGIGSGNTSAGPWKLEYVGIWSSTDNHGIDDVSNYQSIYGCTDVPVFRLYQWNATANEYQHAAYGVVCCYANVSNAVEHTALFVAEGGLGCVLTNSSHSSSMNITFDEDLTTGLTTLIAAATPGITFTRGMGEHSNEWTMDGSMPAGNVLLTVLYKDSTTTSVKFGESTITVESTDQERSVTGYKGFEEYFLSQLVDSVENITADTTVVNPTLTYTSSDANVIGFKNGNNYELSGTLDQMEFCQVGTATLTVEYAGTDDIAKSSVDLLVTVAQPATLTLAANDDNFGTVEVVMPNSVTTGEITVPDGWANNNDPMTPNDMPEFQSVLLKQAKTWTEAPTEGDAFLAYSFDTNDKLHVVIFTNGAYNNEDANYAKKNVYNVANGGKFYYTTGTIPIPIIDNGDGTYSVIPGTEVTVKATPADGYQLASWSNEATVNEAGTQTLTGSGTTTITATFTEREYDVTLADGDEDTQSWTGKVGNAENYSAFPLEATKSQNVTVKYSGTLKVQNVSWAQTSINGNLTPNDDKTEWTLTALREPGDLPLTVTYIAKAVLVNGDVLPTAVDGVTAGTANPIINEENIQLDEGAGLMYKWTTTNEKPTSKEGFVAVPTAEDVYILEDGPVYVWYYIVGDDTHNDSEILDNPITVQLTAPTQYDIVFAKDENAWEAYRNPSAEDKTVKLKYTGEKRVRSVTLKQAEVSYTAPVLKTSALTFNGNQNNVNGSPQSLIQDNTGTVEHGAIIKYSYRYHTIGTSTWSDWSDWSTSPTATNAGVYEVRYKVEPMLGYMGDGEPETSLGSITINKANGWLSLDSYSSSGWNNGRSSISVGFSSSGGADRMSASHVRNNISTSFTGGNNGTMTINKSNDYGSGDLTVSCGATNNYNAPASVTYTLGE